MVQKKAFYSQSRAKIINKYFSHQKNECFLGIGSKKHAKVGQLQFFQVHHLSLFLNFSLQGPVSRKSQYLTGPVSCLRLH